MSQSVFTQSDIQHFTLHGLTEDQIQAQFKILKNDIPHVNINRPCTIGDGIMTLDPSTIDKLETKYVKTLSTRQTIKFVPASGAASRMFHALMSTYNRRRQYSTTTDDASHNQDYIQSRECLNAISDFAFAEDLTSILLKHGLHLNTLVKHKRYNEILEYLLMPKGLNYAHQPKALIPFHRYTDHCRTPLAEHLVEAIEYTCNTRNIASLHFTVSLDHEKAISAYVTEMKSRYARNGVTFNISYSQQKLSTNTITIDENNQPFRDNTGVLVLRQSGHGSLIENLNNLQEDICFIKNIDNVVPDRLKYETYRYKKALGGLLVSVQEKVFSFLKQLDSGPVEEPVLIHMVKWRQQTFSLTVPDEFANQSNSERVTFLHHQFNRPLRICGMVRKTKEFGGGPFWVQHNDRTQSIQIVEDAQINTKLANQQTVFKSSTHFNPVDIVCGLRDYHGNSFDLRKFVDPHTSIMTRKFYEGRTLRILEHPGLWNGSMAYWNTIFVEVPSLTFNPVKTILDLLRPEHQYRPVHLQN
tara:strand:+ start:4073 stop:5653 length:1581 start_codon:yes stop_codon:yes gene_type:complete